jgi:hypothetical protein
VDCPCSSISMIFSNFFLQNILGREEEWGGQLGVASWGWFQPLFYIVCLNQDHFFLRLFSSISMIFSNFFLQNMEIEKEWGGQLRVAN